MPAPCANMRDGAQFDLQSGGTTAEGRPWWCLDHLPKALWGKFSFLRMCTDASVEPDELCSLTDPAAVAQNMMGSSPQEWKQALHQMWFAQYKREVQNDSSGFEHTVSPDLG